MLLLPCCALLSSFVWLWTRLAASLSPHTRQNAAASWPPSPLGPAPSPQVGRHASLRALWRGLASCGKGRGALSHREGLECRPRPCDSCCSSSSNSTLILRTTEYASTEEWDAAVEVLWQHTPVVVDPYGTISLWRHIPGFTQRAILLCI